MQLYIAADGGGSKTEFCLFNERAQILAAYTGAGTNPGAIGVLPSLTAIKFGVDKLLASAGVEAGAVSRAVFFIPLLWRTPQLLDGVFPFPSELIGDTKAALYSSFGASDGLAVLSGTGSFAIGRYNGRVEMTGGWGSAIDDAGSGYSIGRDCLRYLARHADAGRADDRLSLAVKRHFRIENSEQLKAAQVDPQFLSVARVAALCPVVTEAAEDGNEAAIMILSAAADELAKLATSCMKRLGASVRTLKCCLCGGVPLGSHIASEIFLSTLELTGEFSIVDVSRVRPIDGAMRYILESR